MTLDVNSFLFLQRNSLESLLGELALHNWILIIGWSIPHIWVCVILSFLGWMWFTVFYGPNLVEQVKQILQGASKARPFLIRVINL